MKKLFYISFIFSCLLSSSKLEAQLLQPGDAVVSVSPGLFSNTEYCSGNTPVNSSNFATDTVLTIIKVCKAPASALGTCWKMSPNEYSTNTYKNKDWVRNNLGNIFGITIDNTPSKNIFVSATGFYGTQYAGISTGSVFKINGITGALSLLKDLHISAPSSNQLSLGNIKYFNGKLFVTDLYDGKIYMLNATTGSVITTFDPGFSDNSKPCGLAIYNEGGITKVFFSRNKFDATTTSIYSIDFNGNSFGSNLILEIPPNLINSINPITDIAINKKGDRIIFTERTTTSWTSTTSAHSSNTNEFAFDGISWNSTNKNYYIGNYSLHKNSTGGISYSPWIVGTDCIMACDTSIAITADRIGGLGTACNFTFGISNFNNTINGGSNSGVNIDVDNDYKNCEKTFLGDVEVCDTTLECSTCICREWGNGIPTIFPGGTGNPLSLSIPMPGGYSVMYMPNCGASYSFIKGAVAGTLNANYSCIGDCNQVINWQLINTTTNAPVGNGNLNNGAINLSQFNNLACGSYKFIFTPKCGNNTCNTCEYFINIVCDPPPCCPPQTQVTIQPQNASYNSSNNPNGWGTYGQSFILNSNAPMSEIRIDVEHFEINSTDPDCISCTNMPKTWGSLLGAAYNGNGFTRPIISLPFTSSVYGNGRELLYKPGSLMTINNGNVNVNVAMPNASPIDCCILTANICLKFTFKDANCKECTYYYCNENIEIKKSVNGNPNGNQLKNVNKSIQKSIF